MRARKPIPIRWLMTDERMGDALWTALSRLPPGSGVVFRHYATRPAERRALLRRVMRVARARRLLVVVAGTGDADGVHGRARTKGLRTWPAHDRTGALAGKRASADALFVSPIYATRSHAGGGGIGPARATRFARGLGIPLIALGGMTERRWRRLRGFYGWAAIDAWLRR